MLSDEKGKDFWPRQAMMKYGGSFVKALAVAMEKADHVNYAKLTMAFPEYMEEYRQAGEEMEARGS